jgi:hypothetical protein
MGIRILALGLVWAASLCGQRRFSWQGYCFDHPAAPFCSGHEYAIKPQPKDAKHRDVVTNPYAPAPSIVTPTIIVIGGIDWRFADPLADTLAGFNFSGLSTSPLARNLIAQLGASQGITEADLRKIFDGLSGVDQIALSIRDNKIVALVTGNVTDSTLPAPEAGWKAVPVSANAMLVGYPEAVDQAAQRIAMKLPLAEFTRLAVEQQAGSDLWAIGPAALVGPQAVSAGVKRFTLTVSVRNRLTSDLAFEFDAAPDADTLRTWPATLGSAALEGNAVHVRMSMEAYEVQQGFGPIVASPVGQRLAALVQGTRYLPARNATVPSHTKPVIYGLDSGPREVNQYPKQ